MASCEDTNFKDQHGGLQFLHPVAGTDVFPVYRNYFKELINLLKLKIPGLTAAQAETKKKRLFEVQGYYIGKEQLKCVLENEFKGYDGLQITIGLSDDPRTGTGQLMLMLKGAFETDSPFKGTTLSMGENVDNRYYDESSVTYIAGPPLVTTTPPPNSMPNPPYGDT